MKDVNILTSNGVNVQQSLELFGDMEMYDETLTDFLDMAQEKLANLEKFRVLNDMPNYAIEVHALKSDARYLGFLTLGDMAYESEMKSKAGDSAFVNQNHPVIMAEAKRCITLAQTYLGREVVDLTPASNASPAETPNPAPALAQQATPVQPVAPTPVGTPVSQAPVQPVAPTPVGTPVSQTPVQPVAPTPVGTPVSQTPVQPVAPTPVGTPVSQTPVQPVAPTPVGTPVSQTPVQPVAPTPVGTPVSQAPVQPVTPTPVSTPSNPPIGEPTASETIQFFPVDNNVNTIMDESLSAMAQNQNQNSQVPQVKEGIILIIDDSKLVANFVKKVFNAKYDILMANDGAKGIEMANDPAIRPKIKACLVDLYMPNVDGFQVLDNFKESGLFVKTPVAVISGAEDIESINRANSYPIIDILEKPFTDRDIKMVVEKCLAAYF